MNEAGAKHHVVQPCDEPDGRRTWDVVRYGRAVRNCDTRRQARDVARELNAVEELRKKLGKRYVRPEDLLP